ncbi:MAG: hypothetical protein C5B47_06865 [Verrucomicrobia bacterium]|nr:MAG: hypothetical protein C5B47_06865 [Verrucomicrobiota bacterium]
MDNLIIKFQPENSVESTSQKNLRNLHDAIIIAFNNLEGIFFFEGGAKARPDPSHRLTFATMAEGKRITKLLSFYRGFAIY